jgi:exoribonuclease-2
LYFSGNTEAIQPRPAALVAADEQKQEEKQREQQEREAFLRDFKSGTLKLSGGDRRFRFLQDVEALAYGKTEKSRTLKDLGRPETPEEAHRALLNVEAWTPRVNPHPARFGLTLSSAKLQPDPLPDEERLDLTHLAAFAIDNPWSGDPDDAVSLEGNCLWVHVADPAASILPGSPAELEARGRGSTLYLPEGSFRMLAEESLPQYALGLGELSPALSFKITLDEAGAIQETEIIPSLVRVIRLSYQEVDAAVAGNRDAAGQAAAHGGELSALFALGERNLVRRLRDGAVTIEFPEVHIGVQDLHTEVLDLHPEGVEITPIPSYRSADMVRECMLLAGEGAARWAARMEPRLPFPYVTQEVGDLPHTPLPGLAGSYQLRRCMRPRTLSVKPGRHWGLGLEDYTQVTSPLRRYTDLLAHQQIRAFLRRGAYRDRLPLEEDEVLLRMAAGDAAASAAVRAERASRTHWTMVYLSDKRDTPWDGVILERKGNRGTIFIPPLGLETQITLKGEPLPNEWVHLVLSSVNIPQGEAVFQISESKSPLNTRLMS